MTGAAVTKRTVCEYTVPWNRSENNRIALFCKKIRPINNRRCQYVLQTVYAKNLWVSRNGIRGGRIHSLCHASDYHSRHRGASPRYPLLVFLLPLIFREVRKIEKKKSVYASLIEQKSETNGSWYKVIFIERHLLKIDNDVADKLHFILERCKTHKIKSK